MRHQFERNRLNDSRQNPPALRRILHATNSVSPIEVIITARSLERFEVAEDCPTAADSDHSFLREVDFSDRNCDRHLLTKATIKRSLDTEILVIEWRFRYSKQHESIWNDEV